MSRTLARTALTLTSSLLLLAMTALPALAADAATKPDAGENPFLIGSIDQLAATAVAAVALGVFAFMIRPEGPAESDEHH